MLEWSAGSGESGKVYKEEGRLGNVRFFSHDTVRFSPHPPIGIGHLMMV